MVANDFHIKVTKGNQYYSVITESHNVREFQEKMADGRDRNKAIGTQQPIAALGYRGDFLEIVVDVTPGTGGTATASPGLPRKNNALMIDIIDYSGVAPDVQLGGFSKFSKFKGTDIRVSPGMKVGIDYAFLTIVPNNPFTAASGLTTEKQQYVRGQLDPRVTVRCDEDAWADVSQVILKLKPNHDGVFLIPKGALIWCQGGVTPGNIGTGNNFGELV